MSIGHLQPHNLLCLDCIGRVARIVHAARAQPRSRVVARPAGKEARGHADARDGVELFTLERAVNERGEPGAGAGGGEGGERLAVPGEGWLGVRVGEGVGCRSAEKGLRVRGRVLAEQVRATLATGFQKPRTVDCPALWKYAPTGSPTLEAMESSLYHGSKPRSLRLREWASRACRCMESVSGMVWEKKKSPSSRNALSCNLCLVKSAGSEAAGSAD